MVYLFWWIVISTGAFCSDLFPVDIYQSTVYTSSVETSSQPGFAVDNDLLEEKPTCFQTNNDQPDASGQHWILIDFGYVLSNIKEIRLVTEAGYDLSNLSAYTMRRPNLSLQQLVNTSRGIGDLNFNTPEAVLCSSTGEVEAWRTATTIHCNQPRHGRWLAILKSGGLHICMINVYVTQAHSMCFHELTVNEVKTRLAGGVFQFMRHLTPGACRAACMGSPECTGLVFAQRSRGSGNCHLIRPAAEAVPGEQGADEVIQDRFGSLCRRSECVFEVNRCHEGHRYDLQKKSDETSSRSSHQLVDVNSVQTDDWLISTLNSSFYESKNSPRYLVSVHLQGSITCNLWSCGSLRITALQADGYESICGVIDTVDIHVLDSFPILCADYGHPFPVNISTIRLAWKSWHKSTTGEIVKLNVDLLGGHVRIASGPPPSEKRESTTTSEPTSRPNRVTKPVTDSNSSEMNDDEYKIDSAHIDQQLFSSLQPVSKTTQVPNPSSDRTSNRRPSTHVFKTIDSIELTGRQVLVKDNGYETRNLIKEEELIQNATKGMDTKVYGKRGLTKTHEKNTISQSSVSVPLGFGHRNSFAYSPLVVLNALLALVLTFVDIFY